MTSFTIGPRVKVAGLALIGCLGWWSWARSGPAPLSALAALGTLVPGATGQTHQYEIPLQPYRGWWSDRVTLPASVVQIRLRIPLDMPAPVHFHYLVLPENAENQFTGASPIGGLWGQDANGQSIVLPLGALDLVQTAGGATMPVRFAPLISDTLMEPHSSVAWGGLDTWGALNMSLVFIETESDFAHHGSTPHIPIEGFRPGSRTPWLSLTLNGLPPAAKVTIALAPYVQDSGGGPDQALLLFPPKGSVVAPVHPKTAGDYPNDPAILWHNFHALGDTLWQQHVVSGVGSAINGLGQNGVRFSSAWTHGMFSSLPFIWWDSCTFADRVDAGLRRPPDWSAYRLALLPRTTGQLSVRAASLASNLLSTVSKVYNLGIGITDQLAVPPIMLEAFSQSDFATWFETQTSRPFDANNAAKWVGQAEGYHPGVAASLDLWFTTLLNWRLDHLTTTDITFDVLMTIAVADAFDLWDFPHVNDPPLSYADYVLYKTVLDDPTVLSIVMPAAIGMSSGYYFEGGTPEVVDKWGELVSPASVTVPAEAGLRPPVGWAMVTPPLFGQMAAFASVEPLNLMFQWWRGAASGIYEATRASTLPGGFPESDYPWEGWFPVGDGPWTPGPWWTAYQKIPWANLSVGPKFPDWTYPGPAANSWRFTTDITTNTKLNWMSRLTLANYWPAQPPATRETNNLENFPLLTIPTSAYLLGPIEIRVTP